MADNQWLDLEEDESANQSRKMRAVDSSTINKTLLQNEMNALILSVQTAQMTRHLQGAAWWNIMTPASLVGMAGKTAKAHADKTRGVSNHGYGLPHFKCGER